MRKLILVFTVALAGCSADAASKFQAGLATFRSNVAAVNMTIASVSADLASNCGEMQNFAQALETFTTNAKAKAAFAAANAGIVTWCQVPPTNIQTAVAATAKITANARAAYNAAWVAQ